MSLRVGDKVTTVVPGVPEIGTLVKRVTAVHEDAFQAAWYPDHAASSPGPSFGYLLENEGVQWISGEHTAGSSDAIALLAANVLVRS